MMDDRVSMMVKPHFVCRFTLKCLFQTLNKWLGHSVRSGEGVLSKSRLT